MRRLTLIALAALALNCDAVLDTEETNDAGSGDSSADSGGGEAESGSDDAAADPEESAADEGDDGADAGGGGDADADACGTCIGEAVGGACQEAVAACNDSEACNSLGACLEQCSSGDRDCINGCGTDHADGKDLYLAANDCIFCGECASACGVPEEACKASSGDSASGGDPTDGSSGGSPGDTGDTSSPGGEDPFDDGSGGSSEDPAAGNDTEPPSSNDCLKDSDCPQGLVCDLDWELGRLVCVDDPYASDGSDSSGSEEDPI